MTSNKPPSQLHHFKPVVIEIISLLKLIGFISSMTSFEVFPPLDFAGRLCMYYPPWLEHIPDL